MLGKTKKLASVIPLNSEDPAKIFEVVRRVGKGAMGDVFLARKRGTEEYFAIKTCALDNDEGFFFVFVFCLFFWNFFLTFFFSLAFDDVRKEISIISKCENENIVRFFDSFIKGDYLWVSLPLFSFSFSFPFSLFLFLLLFFSHQPLSPLLLMFFFFFLDCYGVLWRRFYC